MSHSQQLRYQKPLRAERGRPKRNRRANQPVPEPANPPSWMAAGQAPAPNVPLAFQLPAQPPAPPQVPVQPMQPPPQPQSAVHQPLQQAAEQTTEGAHSKMAPSVPPWRP